MTAKTRNLYDDIVDCLRAVRRTQRTVAVSDAVMQEFMTDSPRKKKTVQVSPSASSAPASGTSGAGSSAPDALALAADSAPLVAAAVAAMDWDTLENTVRNCRACPLWQTRRNTVFGDGSRQARLLFFGEGPGADEDAQGIPFVGRAGALLTKMIQAMGFTRGEVYICNTVKCRPPGNRNPNPGETEACRAYALRQIELVRPEVIVTLGAVALRFLFPNTYGGIRILRGRWQEFNSIKVMPTYHPAYLLRNPAAKREVWQDLQLVMQVLGKEAPPRHRGGISNPPV